MTQDEVNFKASIPCAACQQGIPRHESVPIEVKYKGKGVIIYVKPHIAKQVDEIRDRYGNNIPVILEDDILVDD